MEGLHGQDFPVPARTRTGCCAYEGYEIDGWNVICMYFRSSYYYHPEKSNKYFLKNQHYVYIFIFLRRARALDCNHSVNHRRRHRIPSRHHSAGGLERERCLGGVAGAGSVSVEGNEVWHEAAVLFVALFLPRSGGLVLFLDWEKRIVGARARGGGSEKGDRTRTRLHSPQRTLSPPPPCISRVAA